MMQRILAITRALLAGDWWGDGASRLPIAPLLFHASLAGVLCALARSELGPYAYGILGLSLPLALTTLPLLGELGPLLRADTAADWIGAQPIKASELRAGRVLCIVILLGGLALGSLTPVILMAPEEISIAGRAALLFAGLAQTYFVAAVLLTIQAVLGGRAESALVLVQTIVFCFVIVGFIAGLRLLPYLAALETPNLSLLIYPPAWFASVLLDQPFAGDAATFAWVACVATVLAAATLVLAPFPSSAKGAAMRSPLAMLLAPLRKLATSFWITREERASFDLVYDALPTERDFVIRAYPLMAIPLAFLLLGADPSDVKGEGLLAILAFSPGIYLPFLLVHVPATATPEARWLIDTSPISEATERTAAAKAVFLRFLVPLFMLLGGIVAIQGSVDLALRLIPPAAVVTFLSMRFSWQRYVEAPPLSTPVNELASAWSDDFTGRLFAAGLLMTGLAIASWRLVDRWQIGVGIAVVAVAVEVFTILRIRRAEAGASLQSSNT
ncbi:MAG: hypothetical protein ACI841_003090 [Planctomycetota bacterium]|jgi:hypothetical protein